MNTLNIKTGTFEKNYDIDKLNYATVNRKIVDLHRDSFKEKMIEFGFLVPIIVDHKANLIEGHHRVDCAKQMGIKNLPAYIVDWIDVTNKDNYQKFIMTINNNNRRWTALDYLESYAQTRKDYAYVYKKYLETKDVFSVGNVLNIYFNFGCTETFKKGNATIKMRLFSEYLFKRFYDLKKEYGSFKIQAFTINRVCSIAHSYCKGNTKEMNFIFNQLETWAEQDNPILSSVEWIRPEVKKQISFYREIQNDKVTQ
jgi:type III secretory pathway component EscV